MSIIFISMFEMGVVVGAEGIKMAVFLNSKIDSIRPFLLVLDCASQW